MKLPSLYEVFGVEKPEYLVGVTYEIWDQSQFGEGDDDPRQKGWELSQEPSTPDDLLQIAGTYGIQPNDLETRHVWGNDSQPKVDEMNGDQTYYQMFVKHIDGSDLTREERSDVNALLSDL